MTCVSFILNRQFRNPFFWLQCCARQIPQATALSLDESLIQATARAISLSLGCFAPGYRGAPEAKRPDATDAMHARSKHRGRGRAGNRGRAARELDAAEAGRAQ